MQFTTAQITAALRWGGSTLAGYLVGKGYVDASTGAAVATVVLGGGTFLWSQIQKMQTKSLLTNTAGSPAALAVPAVPK